MSKGLITRNQAKELENLKYNGDWSRVIFNCDGTPGKILSLPSVDQAIDWLRRKYNVHIYTSIPPFVDPTDDKHPILYRYAVKYCNKRDGWNGRVHIGETNLSKNVYSLKRQAIWLAIRWIKKNLKPKVSLGKVRRK